MKQVFQALLKVVAYGLLLSAIIFFLTLAFFPSLVLPTVTEVKQIPWTKTNEETPKAILQFTFSSKIAFTTNSPINVKLDIPHFRKDSVNDTNLAILIGNSQSPAFTTPLSQFPSSALIWISTDNAPLSGEIDIEFTSQGSYGFLIFSGVLPELSNMTVAYIPDSGLIEIEPFNVRYGSEIPIRALSVTIIFGLIGAYSQREKIIKRATKKTPKPVLRITPMLSTPAILGTLGLEILIENIGYSIAKEIELRCKLIPNDTIPLRKNGVFKHSLLSHRDAPIKYTAISHVESSELLSQQKLIIEVSFLNEDDKKQKSIFIEVTMKELEERLREL